MVPRQRDESLTREDGLCYLAALDGNATNVSAYLRRGAHIGNLDARGLLERVAKKGNVDVLRILLDAGADVNASDPELRVTPLMSAARAGRIDAMRFLLDRGAAVGATAEERYRTMAWAVRCDDADVVNLLVDQGVEPDAHAPSGYSALMIAASRGSIRAVMTLLDRGADVNAVSDDGHSALRNARRLGRTEVEIVLKQAGAEEPRLSAFQRWRDRLLIPFKQRLMSKVK